MTDCCLMILVVAFVYIYICSYMYLLSGNG